MSEQVHYEIHRKIPPSVDWVIHSTIGKEEIETIFKKWKEYDPSSEWRAVKVTTTKENI